jgi:L-amino acid N-acyltransferase YncA
VYFRCFQVLRELPEANDRFAVVALDPAQPNEIIAVVRYERDPGTVRAEFAAVVEDGWQGRGLGLRLTYWLIEAARQQGIRTLCALILPENGRIRQLFRRLGLPLREWWEEGVEHVDIDLG